MVYKKSSQQILNRMVENKAVTFAESEILSRFITKRKELNKIKTESRAAKVANDLCMLRKHNLLPVFDQITTDAVFSCLNGMPKYYAQNTCRENWNILKTFLKWGMKNNLFTVDFEQLGEYTAPEIIKDSVKPSDILDDEKINRMIDAAQTARDKAIIVVFAETGCRPKELTTMKWSDITFTGKSVQFRLIDAKKPSKIKYAFVTKRISYIVDLQKSQASDSQDMNVFRQTINSRSIVISAKPLDVIGFHKMIKTIADRAGVTLPRGAKCKLFRASSVTNKLKAGVPPVAIMNSHWAAGAASKMFDHYEKLAGVDVENMMLSADGKPIDNRPAKVDKASVGFVCIKCNTVNPAGAKFCQECGSKPDAVESARVQELESQLAEIEAKYNRIIEMLSKK